MFNSETLEVAIGMAFMFLSVSLICTAAKEWLEGVFKWRAMDLERALRTLLDDADGTMTAELLQHPLLYSLFAGRYDPAQLRNSWLTPGEGSKHMRLSHRRNLPSYIPACQFAVALLDSVARGPAPPPAPATPADTSDAPHPGPLTVEALRQSAMGLASAHVQRAVLAALDHSDGDLALARVNIERWFNATMERASGWYKRRTQAVLFMLGFAIAVVMNFDALHVMQRLTADKAFREVVVKEAAGAASPGESASAVQSERILNAKQALERVDMPIGWRMRVQPAAPAAPIELSALPVPRQLCASHDAAPCERAQWLGADWLGVLCGWLLTAFAVTLGAPFWFDVLSKFMTIRSTLKPRQGKGGPANEG